MMNRGALVFTGLLSAALLATPQCLLAVPVLSIPLGGGFLDVDYFAGSGANTAYVVVDFAGNAGHTHGFGYRFDDPKTAADGLLSLAAAGALQVTTQDFGSPGSPNLFLTEMAYLGDADQPDFNADGRYWHYWLGAYQPTQVVWSQSQYGISGRDFSTGAVKQLLSNGEFIGFIASTDNPALEPRLPVAVPEPTALLLSAIGGLGVLLLAAIARQSL